MENVLIYNLFVASGRDLHAGNVRVSLRRTRTEAWIVDNGVLAGAFHGTFTYNSPLDAGGIIQLQETRNVHESLNLIGILVRHIRIRLALIRRAGGVVVR